MSAPNWQALPHGPLTARGNVWVVDGALKKMPLRRVMTIAKTAAGKLVVHNAVALDDEGMAALDALGEVAFIVVPNRFHRLDAPRFKARYPNAKIVCPKGSRAKVEERVPVDLTYDEFPNDEAIEFRSLAGVGDIEGVVVVKSGGEVTLVMNDAVFNMQHLGGFHGFVLKHVTQSSGGPRVSRLFRVLALKDRNAFRKSLEDLARMPGLTRVVVGHHEVIEDDPRGVLERVAQAL